MSFAYCDYDCCERVSLIPSILTQLDLLIDAGSRPALAVIANMPPLDFVSLAAAVYSSTICYVFLTTLRLPGANVTTVQVGDATCLVDVSNATSVGLLSNVQDWLGNAWIVWTDTVGQTYSRQALPMSAYTRTCPLLQTPHPAHRRGQRTGPSSTPLVVEPATSSSQSAVTRALLSHLMAMLSKYG